MISRIPILNHIASNFLGIEIKESPFSPAFLSRNNAKNLANRFNCRLPHEKEWEYVCRALEKTLFTFGDNLPDDEKLNRWLKWDFSNLEEFNCNKFGLYGLFTGEWCEDKYRLNYKDDVQIEPNNYTIRGGGALFWPWQAEEWIWCLSAMRMPSNDLMDGRCGFRLVYDLGNVIK